MDAANEMLRLGTCEVQAMPPPSLGEQEAPPPPAPAEFVTFEPEELYDTHAALTHPVSPRHALAAAYKLNAYPGKEEMARLAALLNMDPATVETWFDRRRFLDDWARDVISDPTATVNTLRELALASSPFGE